MKNSEVQCVYWSHSRYDSDLQDHVFGEVMPSFFTDGNGDTRNLLGIESAGTFTDQERDDYLRRTEKDPVNDLITDQIDGVQNAVRARLVCLAQVLANRGNGCLLSRETLLLGKWNAENPHRVVLPYHESYPAAEIRDEIGQIADHLLSVSFLRKDKRIFWRSLVGIVRTKTEKMAQFIAERDENWLRMLRDLTLQTEQSKTRFKILVTLGRWHFRLTEKLRSELSDRLVIHDDIVLPDSNSHGSDGTDYLVDRQLRGDSPSDEDYLRAIFFSVGKEISLYGPDQDRTGFYTVDRAKLAEIWESCRRLSVEEIASSLNLIVDESKRTEQIPVDELVTGSTLLNLIVDESKCTEQIPVDELVTGSTLQDDHFGNIGGSADDLSLLVDRRNHPNNLYIDRLCVLSLLCDAIGVKDSDEETVSLLKQVVDKILPQKLPQLREEICEFVLSESHQLPLSMSAIVKFIASQSSKDPNLWDDPSKKNCTGGRLIGLARTLCAKRDTAKDTNELEQQQAKAS